MPGAARRRRARVPNVYRLGAALPAAQHASGAHALLAGFIQHIAFAREQCHAPFASLQAHAQVRAACARAWRAVAGGNAGSARCSPLAAPRMHTRALHPQACQQLQQQQAQTGRRARLKTSSRRSLKVWRRSSRGHAGLALPCLVLQQR